MKKLLVLIILGYTTVTSSSNRQNELPRLTALRQQKAQQEEAERLYVYNGCNDLLRKMHFVGKLVGLPEEQPTKTNNSQSQRTTKSPQK